jgi:hypothetical protein
MAQGTPRRTSWIVAPPELCVLCRNPLLSPTDTSSWNGSPAHRECVKIHLLNRDPAFRDWDADPADEAAEGSEGPISDLGTREDDDESPE